MSDTKGLTTSVTDVDEHAHDVAALPAYRFASAGSWKHSDLPEPVAMSTDESRPERACDATSRCHARNVL